MSGMTRRAIRLDRRTVRLLWAFEYLLNYDRAKIEAADYEMGRDVAVLHLGRSVPSHPSHNCY
nr:hypothetical protein [uncultured Pseudomonas sp.]